MSCTKQEVELSALVDGELNTLEERQVRQHLAGCPVCRRAMTRLQRVSKTIRHWDPAPESAPSGVFADRVIDSLPAKPGSFRPSGRLIEAGVRFARLPAVSAAAVLLLVVSLSVASLVAALPGAAPEWPGGAGDPESALVAIRRAISEIPDLETPLAGLPAPEVAAELDLGGPLPSGRPAAPPALTEEELLVRLGLTREGDRWLTDAGWDRLREFSELRGELQHLVAQRTSGSRATPVPGKHGPVATWLASLRPAEGHGFGALTILPVNDVSARDADFAVIGTADAFRKGRLGIKEREGRVTAYNSDRERFVFLAGGTILRGGRQDRILTRGVLIPPKTAASLPTLCCERNRSTGGAAFEGSPGLAPPGVRRLLVGAANQDAIWSRISRHLTALSATTDTEGLQALYSTGSGAKQFERYERALVPAFAGERVVGFLAFADGEFLGGEVFANHALLEQLGPRFLRAYVLEALLAKGATTPVLPATAGRLLATAVDATYVLTPGAVFGQETEFDGGKGGLCGFALMAAGEERPLHVSVFPGGTNLGARGGGGGAPAKAATGESGSAPPPPPPPSKGPPEGSEAERRLKDRQEERKKTPKIQDPPGGGSGEQPRPPRNGGGTVVPPKKPPVVPGGGVGVGGGKRRGIDERR